VHLPDGISAAIDWKTIQLTMMRRQEFHVGIHSNNMILTQLAKRERIGYGNTSSSPCLDWKANNTELNRKWPTFARN